MNTNNDIVRIAMWSGPRNISTAMMRSFENRTDTAVWDEPFYAAYLTATGLDHPMRGEVIAAGIANPAGVVEEILAEPPGGAAVFYQKHMTHHMIEGFDRGWLNRMINCFLIRAPERVLASYVAKREEVALADIGFVQQEELFRQVADTTGDAPPVIDAGDVVADPEAVLRKLCAACNIGFDDAMLTWPQGPRASDGAWAPHWYGAVWSSTGFKPPEAGADRPPALPAPLARIAEAARPAYEALARYRLAA